MLDTTRYICNLHGVVCVCALCCPQVEALTAQVSELEEAITEATQQSTMAAQQLQQVG